MFIHAAFRSSSTWFWLKFRELPSTLCYYEPFNPTLNWISPDQASSLDFGSWESRHPTSEPYYREYIPLLRKKGGVEHFEQAMSMQWFIPEGGLRGALHTGEQDYLALLIKHASEEDKVPVLGACRSLGRVWPIKEAFGGYHIFQYRNLWQQWLSSISFRRRGDMTFYVTVMDMIFRNSDPYLRYLLDCGLRHASNNPRRKESGGKRPLRWKRVHVNLPRNQEKADQLEFMPEQHTFSLFMGLHIYLYLHAQLCTDLSVDVTRIGRDAHYRSDIEHTIADETGLVVSFADAADTKPGTADFDTSAIDWDEIREHARVAAEMLSQFGEARELVSSANAFIDDTIAELRTADAAAGAKHKAEPAGAKKPASKTIGLCMIVKNETKVIRRCLETALPLVDYILVVDTGSTDGTQKMIRDFLAEHNVKGAVIEEPWRDFAYNRSFALARLREVSGIDYALIIDADNILEFDPGFDPAVFKVQMTKDIYDVAERRGNIEHHRPQLVNNKLPFSYKGVLHEYLEVPSGNLTRGTIKEFTERASTGGARSENPFKYQDDAAVLESALATETDPFLISRYTFYLAQSYRDCGETKKALTQYLKRAELGYWTEEVYVSLFEAGNLMAKLDRPFDEVIATWERANQIVPARSDALHAAARYCREMGKNAEGMEIARRGLDLKQPDGLFVQPAVYNYALLDEFAVNAYWSGSFRESLDACLKLLGSDKLPPEMVKRVAGNALFAANKMPAAKAPALGAPGADDFIDQHKLVPPRSLHARVKDAPRVMVTILAKQKEAALPLYLECIEALDYPKSSIVLYIRTNNNTDKTEQILRDWVARVGHLYHKVEFDASNVTEKIEQYREHEWNATRFSVLGHIRNQSIRRARELSCDFYFVADVDNFIRSTTLRELVALDLPIVSPLLRSIVPEQFYSNYHAEIDKNGYYKNCDQYLWILCRYVRGVIEVPLVHCTYLVRSDVIQQLAYQDKSKRHEYVIFSESARNAGIPQYLDNRQIYGYVTFGEDDDHHVRGGIERARVLLEDHSVKTEAGSETPSLSPPVATMSVGDPTPTSAFSKQSSS